VALAVDAGKIEIDGRPAELAHRSDALRHAKILA
jgi:hypothetical protein